MQATSGLLVQTKFQPPAPRSDTILRPQLVHALHAAMTSRRLTLIAAPAGSGKTTLVADACRSDGALRIAWLALDVEDNDPAQFVTVLIAALRRVAPACGGVTEALLTSLEQPGTQVRRLVGALINDLIDALAGPTVLVLDDLHLIDEPAVHVALDYLIERMPPTLHVVATTRYDPPLALPRLRARGDLTEIRLADLRFTSEETARFLNERLALNLPPADVRSLHTRAEGWAAGLRLLAISLEPREEAGERAALLAHLHSSGRHAFEFLADEVLRRQQPDLQDFLLQTSILPVLTPRLAQALTGRADAATLLEYLERRNLFLISTGDAEGQAERAFRYHALFAAFLQQTLARETPERLPELHRRAAQAQEDPAQAVAHYLAASCWTEAAAVIERVGGAMLGRGLLETVRGWLDALPAGTREANPRLLFLTGRCAWQRGAVREACTLLEPAVAGLAAAEDTTWEGEALAYLTAGAFMQGEYLRASAYARRALERPLDSRTRVRLLLERARVALLLGERRQSADDVDAAIALSAEAPSPEVMAALITHLHPLISAQDKGVARFEGGCALVEAHLDGQSGPARAALDARRCLVHLWRGKLDECLDAGERSLSMVERYGSDDPLIDTWVIGILGLVHGIRGARDEGRRYFERLADHVAKRDLSGGPRAMIAYFEGRLRCMQGNADEARAAYERLIATLAAPPAAVSAIQPTMLRGLIEMGKERYREAEATLHEAARLAQSAPSAVIFGSASLVLAQLYQRTDRARAALDAAAPVLARCEAEDTPGFVLWEGPGMVPVLRLAVERGVHAAFATRLLVLLGAPAPAQAVRIPETGEHLSAREVELLRLVATGAGNREIAAHLVIGEATVKTHLVHIFQKLAVKTRGEAVSRARSLMIV